MANLPFNEDIVRSLAEFRQSGNVDWLVSFFIFITNLGDVLGIVLIVGILYWAVDKRKALSIAAVTLLTNFVNVGLKELIRNPRPFVLSGETDKMWAVKTGGFSTPSGHSQTAGTLYTYLYLKFRKPQVLAFSVVMIFLIGFSRPFLGVHYVEDVLLGWTVGILVALVVYRYEDEIVKWLKSIGMRPMVLGTLVLSLGTSLLVGFLSGFSEEMTFLPTTFGLLFGVVWGYFMEKKFVNFEAKAKDTVNLVLRVAVGMFCVVLVLFGLDVLFALITSDTTLLGYILRFVRYALVAVTALALAPFTFIKLSLAGREA